MIFFPYLLFPGSIFSFLSYFLLLLFFSEAIEKLTFVFAKNLEENKKRKISKCDDDEKKKKTEFKSY